LQIGCGLNYLDGWINTDYIPETKHILFLDAARRFPFDNNSMDYIFSEHLIEHLDFRKAKYFIRESHRTLKPGGKIRIATPDLKFLIELYNPEKTPLQERYIRWSTDRYMPDIKVYLDAFVINYFFRAWDHQFIYDFKALRYLLTSEGFIDVIECRSNESSDENLKNIDSHGKKIGDEFNKLESLIVEAAKP
jgi:predicted SAM-dependent methyltransferase